MILYISDRSVNSPVMEGKDGRRCPSTYIHTYITNITNPCEKPHPDARILSIPPPLSPPNNSTGPIYLICTYVSHSHSTPHTTRHKHKHTYRQQRRPLPIPFESQNPRIPFHSISISTISHPTPKLSNPRPRGRSAGTGPRPRGGGPLCGIRNVFVSYFILDIAKTPPASLSERKKEEVD